MATDKPVYLRSDTVDSPSRRLLAVTPNDSNELSFLAKGLYIGGAGNVAVIAADDSSAVTISGVPAGTILPIRARIVMSTNTTATNIVALG